jgi:hypothetical protein
MLGHSAGKVLPLGCPINFLNVAPGRDERPTGRGFSNVAAGDSRRGKSGAALSPSARKRCLPGGLRSSALAHALEQPRLSDRVRVSFGWGTLLTNDFQGLVEDDALAPFSLVCKAVAANGRPAVKLSDDPEKAMGPEAEIARYKRVLGVGEQERVEVLDQGHHSMLCLGIDSLPFLVFGACLGDSVVLLLRIS